MFGLGVSEYALESETDANQSQGERYFKGDLQVPICKWKDCKGTEEIVSVLMTPPSYIVCKKGPLKCAKNASFSIDTRSLKHPTDWKSGDLNLSVTWDASAQGSLRPLKKSALLQSHAHPEVPRLQFNLRRPTGPKVSAKTSSVEAMSCELDRRKEEGTFYCGTSPTRRSTL